MANDINAVLARLEKITNGGWRYEDSHGTQRVVGKKFYKYGEPQWQDETVADNEPYYPAPVDPDVLRAIALLPELVAIAKAAAAERSHPIMGSIAMRRDSAKLDAALSALAKAGDAQ